MASILRGAALDCARALAPVITFKSGRAKPTPAPRSIVRRDIALVLNWVFLRSFVTEKIARHDRVDDIADSVPRATRAVQDLLHLFAIREADRGASGVGDKLADEIPRHCLLIVLEQEPFEFADVLETAPVGEDPGGIHRERVVKGERLARKANAWFGLHALRVSAIAVAPAAHDVETLERESRRVDQAMARIAGGVGAVLVQLLEHGHGAPDIRLDRGHACRLREAVAENALHDPDAAEDRRGCGAVGGHF